MNGLELLPARIAAKSISSDEVVLPMAEALEAIDTFEAKGILILGWQGWLKTQDCGVGVRNAPQGTVSLDHLSVAEAARVCRDTIRQDAESWCLAYPETTDVLHFCISVRE